MKCSQVVCSADAVFAYEWPGHAGHCFACVEHRAIVVNVLAALGIQAIIYPAALLAYEPLLCEPCWAFLRLKTIRWSASGTASALHRIMQECTRCAAQLEKRDA